MSENVAAFSLFKDGKSLISSSLLTIKIELQNQPYACHLRCVIIRDVACREPRKELITVLKRQCVDL